jgi:hypothetical protein
LKCRTPNYRKKSSLSSLLLPKSAAWQVDGRTGLQWLNSVKAYLKWRSGDSWRRMSDLQQRNAAERWNYLDALRLITDVSYSDTVDSEQKPRLLTKPTKAQVTARKLSTESRGWLVEELLKADPKLTDKKLLLRLQRPKLASMLAERLTKKTDSRPGSLERTA